ncbi:unnamed protein product [Bathycoccus prasinos]
MGVDDHREHHHQQRRRLCVRGRSTRRSVLSSLFFFVVFVVFAHNAFANGDSSPTKKKNPIKVLGYLPDWRIANETTSESIVHALCARTDAIVLFSIEVDEFGRLEKLDRLPSALNLERLKNAKKRFECEIHVTIGGSSRTNGFAKATSTKAMRNEFVKSVSSFLYEQYEDIFDGVDLNWSYPNDETEWRNLGKFAKALKKDFREHDRTKKISIAYYPNENQEQILEMLECSEFADGLHAMAYDLDDRDGHANLKFATQTLNYAQDSFTGGKIMRLGVPFYGRSIPEDASTAPEWRPYGDVLRDNEYELKDETNVAKSKDGVEVWFNGKDLIRKKVEMCRLFEDVCEGIFVWELGQDVSMSDIEDNEEEEGNSKKIDFRTRREKSLLAALTRAAWGDEKYDEMLAKEMQFYEEDEKKRKKNAEKEEEKKDEL